MRDALAFLLVACLGLAAGRADARDIVADLSEHEIRITADFAGEELLLFGVTERGDDVVVVVRGPDTPVVVRRKERVLGIWMNLRSIQFGRVPSYFYVAATPGLDERALSNLLSFNRIGLDRFPIDTTEPASPEEVTEFREALVRNKQVQQLYAAETGAVTRVGDVLFRTRIPFPSNVLTGAYRVEVYQVRDGRMIQATTTPLRVTKTGVGAYISSFAHENSAAYGLIAIIVAAMAGWLGGLVFRK